MQATKFNAGSKTDSKTQYKNKEDIIETRLTYAYLMLQSKQQCISVSIGQPNYVTSL
jgi:hypothetical protein